MIATTVNESMPRGFFIADAADRKAERHYLLPKGFLDGASASRAVAVGAALPLHGGPLAFSALEVARRVPGQAGVRQSLTLADARILYPFLIDQLTARPMPWAGFDGGQQLIMGVINITPDSFSDGGEFFDADSAIAQGMRLLEAGADILDIGGESTRPGAAPVSPEEEIARVIPVITALARQGAILSIDTRHAAVMQAAIDAGARIINDVTALTGDAESLRTAASSDAALILMHMQGDPATMQADPRYDDAVLDLIDYFDARLAVLQTFGLSRARVALDPGIGFGKTLAHNLEILRDLAAFHIFGCPVALGVSRKSLIGRLSRAEQPKDRLAGSLAMSVMGFGQGVQIHRVHDVAEAAQARSVWRALAVQC